MHARACMYINAKLLSYQYLNNSTLSCICTHICYVHFFVLADSIPIVFSDFGAGDGLILLTEVNCSGTEENLASCGHGGIADHFCTHREDAGAVCQGVCVCVCLCVCVYVTIIYGK